jgi:hypothetical protein
MKTLAALIAGSLLLASACAFAGDAHRCARGTHWDPGKMECVPDEPKK